MFSLLTVGFLLGIRHALEADHIATVASLASTNSSRRSMLKQALAWSIGHSLTLFIIGGIVLWMDTLIPVTIASGLEMAVGVMMIILGIDVVRRALRSNFHFHSHRHDEGKAHIHGHSHTPDQLELHHITHDHHHSHATFPLRALLIGLIHGAAGSAALILLFVDRIDSIAMGVLYIALFSIGCIAGMLLFSFAISVPLAFTAKRLTRLFYGLQVSIGVLTSGIGLMLVLERI